ncbi:ubiquinol-cytochrome c chaperone [Aureimonas sp. SA4125]|uniref:ubiquinol-cytochrome C chaperone family protein n=1 Tax=Aureimonas sp. SA4125 TaxID=2826993 RepID=UPI001CC801CD|nr:ubiquinol-cytochrome C chaperone family protein [Aureimonas sp. SA4125]BDA84070.1 ubiquinol-cytochrome c chaperone [Aureimonas sp. SA4125]
MLERFRKLRRNRAVVDTLYAAIVADARAPDLYQDSGLPDTVMGRFESLSIHVFLFLARCRDDAGLKALAQDLVDRFIRDVEDSIREIGVGDPSVPKRMRKLAGMFYERVAAYDAPLRTGDAAGLGAALLCLALPVERAQEAGLRLATYMMAQKAALDAVRTEDITAGRLDAKE